ncbi:MAG TPA: HD domain-containing protein [Methanoregulaceae archaeon]|nr:HD domain-containing protein [Methanoregulaceae archaeon]
MIPNVMEKMIGYFGSDTRRINHALKVFAFARIISYHEHLDSETEETVLCTALLHDIGIVEAERKYHSSAGVYQQIEGPAVARKILEELGIPGPMIDRVCFITGNHHTYTKIDGTDFQILVEADFLVNIFEDAMDKAATESIYHRIFKTDAGKRLLLTMYPC